MGGEGIFHDTLYRLRCVLPDQTERVRGKEDEGCARSWSILARGVCPAGPNRILSVSPLSRFRRERGDRPSAWQSLNELLAIIAVAASSESVRDSWAHSNVSFSLALFFTLRFSLRLSLSLSRSPPLLGRILSWHTGRQRKPRPIPWVALRSVAVCFRRYQPQGAGFISPQCFLLKSTGHPERLCVRETRKITPNERTVIERTV